VAPTSLERVNDTPKWTKEGKTEWARGFGEKRSLVDMGGEKSPKLAKSFGDVPEYPEGRLTWARASHRGPGVRAAWSEAKKDSRRKLNPR